MKARDVMIQYRSVLAPFIEGLLRMKVAAGYNMKAAKHVFKELDNYVLAIGTKTPELTEEIITGWASSRLNDRDNTLYAKFALITNSRDISYIMEAMRMCHDCHVILKATLPRIFSARKKYQIFSLLRTNSWQRRFRRESWYYRRFFAYFIQQAYEYPRHCHWSTMM